MQPETRTPVETPVGKKDLRRVPLGTRDWWQTIWANARGFIIHQPAQLSPFRRRYALTLRVVGSVLDLRGSWYTTGQASCRLLKPSRWWCAALPVTVVLVATLAWATLHLGPLAAILWWPTALALLVTPAGGVRTTRDAAAFPRMPDRMSESVVRHSDAPPGAGRHLVQTCHHLADENGWIIGGKADNHLLVDRVYLPAGRETLTHNSLHTWCVPKHRRRLVSSGYPTP